NVSTGLVDVPSNTPSGSYVITYNICEKGTNPLSILCDKATVTIEVPSPSVSVFADDDSDNPILSSNVAQSVLNVFSNDFIGVHHATNSNVDLVVTIVDPKGFISLKSDGTVELAPNAPAGTYELTYKICSKVIFGDCDTATATVVVISQTPSISIIKTATAIDENKDGFATAGETIRYNFSITNTGNVPLTNIKIVDLLPGLVLTGAPITLMVGEKDTATFVGIYKITQADASNEKVLNQATVYGTSPLGVVVSDFSDVYSIITDVSTVLPVKNCVIKVLNALTPNNDGDNDYLHIEGLDCFSNNAVEIYNRWGVLVFETNNYNNKDNVFNGYSRGRVTVSQSEGLPTGTYFYIIKYVDLNGDGMQKSGYLYLSR
ncbi:gliding motility-associated C-terminal domain-containing protein, partial [Flavobacterium sp.]|uniref:T9SS type B sorting domain-containing protein n=1 Tax=Flavobacterium sp. TaxID=239 RepID=UPI003C33EB03